MPFQVTPFLEVIAQVDSVSFPFKKTSFTSRRHKIEPFGRDPFLCHLKTIAIAPVLGNEGDFKMGRLIDGSPA